MQLNQVNVTLISESKLFQVISALEICRWAFQAHLPIRRNTRRPKIVRIIGHVTLRISQKIYFKAQSKLGMSFSTLPYRSHVSTNLSSILE